jgi:hypothetical protein
MLGAYGVTVDFVAAHGSWTDRSSLLERDHLSLVLKGIFRAAAASFSDFERRTDPEKHQLCCFVHSGTQVLEGGEFFPNRRSIET